MKALRQPCRRAFFFFRLGIHSATSTRAAPLIVPFTHAPFTNRLTSLFQCACEGVELAGCESLSVLDVSTVTERNCVAARRGGEHREVNDQSVTQVNSIRPIVVASLLEKGEA